MPEKDVIYFRRAFFGAFGALGATQIRKAYSIPKRMAITNPSCRSMVEFVYSVSKNKPITEVRISSVITALPIFEVFRALYTIVLMS